MVAGSIPACGSLFWVPREFCDTPSLHSRAFGLGKHFTFACSFSATARAGMAKWQGNRFVSGRSGVRSPLPAFLVVVGCCWLLLVVVGCCWLLLVVVGCQLLLFVVCCLLLFVVCCCSVNRKNETSLPACGKTSTSGEVRTPALKRGPELESGALTTRPQMPLSCLLLTRRLRPYCYFKLYY